MPSLFFLSFVFKLYAMMLYSLHTITITQKGQSSMSNIAIATKLSLIYDSVPYFYIVCHFFLHLVEVSMNRTILLIE